MITLQELKQYLKYCAVTGTFIWINKASRSTRIGSIAGNRRSDGYVVITIKGKKYLAHRLAWLYVYETWPKGIIDHIDRNTSNNCIENLRDVTPKQSSYNTGNYSTNTSGVKGVGKSNDKWQAKLTFMGELFYLGSYYSKEKAIEVITKFKEEHGI